MLCRVLIVLGAIVLATSANAWMFHAGGSPGISPSAVTSANLKVWFSGDVGCINGSSAACADGDSVATWQDRSGNGNNATQGGCTATPVYHTAVLGNGKSSILFTAASTQCLVDSYAGAVGTVIVVYYSVSAGGFAAVISGKPQAGKTTTAYDIYAETSPVAGSSGSYSVRQFSFGTTSSSSAYTWYTNPQRMRNLWSISGMTQDGTTLKSYEQDSLLASMPVPGGATVYTATGQVIGAGDFNNVIGGGPSYFSGYIAEVIVYDGALSSSDYAGVVTWLQAKYNLAPSGNYLMMAENEAAGPYADLNLYLLQGDGTNFKPLPTSYVPTTLSGQTIAATLAMQLLTDDHGTLVKYNGLYWAENSRCPFSGGELWPCLYVDILSSPDLFTWTVAATLNTDTLGITDGVTSTRGTFNDGWIMDRGHGNAIYALLNASNNEQNLAGTQEWAVPVTLNGNGTVTVGTAVAFAGSHFPFGSTGTPNTGFYVEWVSLIGSTYYAFYTNLASGGTLQYATSSSFLTGYNAGGSLTGITGSPAEWPHWIQSNGNGTLYWNNSPTNTKQATANDGALGTVSGLTVGASLGFQKAGSLSQFVPQGASVAKLPAISLP